MTPETHTLYLLNYDASTDINILETWLSPEEQAQLSRRRHPARHREFVVSRYAIKQQQGLTTTTAPLYSLLRQGPYLQTTATSSVSLSHSRFMIGFLPVPPHLQHRMALDIEWLSPTRDTAAISQLFARCEQKLSQTDFYLHWTQKEALAKVLGMSINEVIAQPVQKLAQQHDLKFISAIEGSYAWSVAIPCSADITMTIQLNRLT